MRAVIDGKAVEFDKGTPWRALVKQPGALGVSVGGSTLSLNAPARDGAQARDEDGWCVAIDQRRMCCSIYGQRPAICRKFEMGGPYCREVRADYADRNARGIPLALY